MKWKTYSVGDEEGGAATNYEEAQVLAYSTLEARRLGMAKYDEIFKAVTGLTLKQAWCWRLARKPAQATVSARSTARSPTRRMPVFFFKKTKMDLTLLNLRPVSSVVVSVK